MLTSSAELHEHIRSGIEEKLARLEAERDDAVKQLKRLKMVPLERCDSIKSLRTSSEGPPIFIHWCDGDPHGRRLAVDVVRAMAVGPSACNSERRSGREAFEASHACKAAMFALCEDFYKDTECVALLDAVIHNPSITAFLVNVDDSVPPPAVKYLLHGDSAQRLFLPKDKSRRREKISLIADFLSKAAIGGMPCSPIGVADVVFVSYASKDKDLVHKFAAKLDACAGLTDRVWIDYRHLVPGMDWDTQLSHALYGAKVMILCQSPNFFASRNCIKEVKIVARRMETGDQVMMFPIHLVEEQEVPVELRYALHMVDPGKHTSNHHRVDVLQDEGGIDSFAENIATDVREFLERPIVDVLPVLPEEEEVDLSLCRVAGERPRSAEHFIGRVKEAMQITVLLTSNSAMIIEVTGRPGMGKSALCEHVLADMQRAPHFGDSHVTGIVYTTAATSLCSLFVLIGEVLDSPSVFASLAHAEDDNVLIQEGFAILRGLQVPDEHIVVLFIDGLENCQDHRGYLTNNAFRAFLLAALSTKSCVRVLTTARLSLLFGHEADGDRTDSHRSKTYEWEGSIGRVSLVGLPPEESAKFIARLDAHDITGLRTNERESRTICSTILGAPEAILFTTSVLLSNPSFTPGRMAEKLTTSQDEGKDPLEMVSEDVFMHLSPDCRFILEAIVIFGRHVPMDALVFIASAGLDISTARIASAVHLLVQRHVVTRRRDTLSTTGTMIDMVRHHLHPADASTLESSCGKYYSTVERPVSVGCSLDDLDLYLRELNHWLRAMEVDEAAELLVNRVITTRGGLRAETPLAEYTLADCLLANRRRGRDVLCGHLMALSPEDRTSEDHWRTTSSTLCCKLSCVALSAWMWSADPTKEAMYALRCCDRAVLERCTFQDTAGALFIDSRGSFAAKIHVEHAETLLSVTIRCAVAKTLCLLGDTRALISVVEITEAGLAACKNLLTESGDNCEDVGRGVMGRLSRIGGVALARLGRTVECFALLDEVLVDITVRNVAFLSCEAFLTVMLGRMELLVLTGSSADAVTVYAPDGDGAGPLLNDANPALRLPYLAVYSRALVATGRFDAALGVLRDMPASGWEHLLPTAILEWRLATLFVLCVLGDATGAKELTSELGAALDHTEGISAEWNFCEHRGLLDFVELMEEWVMSLVSQDPAAERAAILQLKGCSPVWASESPLPLRETLHEVANAFSVPAHARAASLAALQANLQHKRGTSYSLTTSQSWDHLGPEGWPA